MKLKHCFIVTSAINSRFGIYTPEQRFQQTLDTLVSIYAHVPDAKIVLMEVTGVPLTDAQRRALSDVSNVFLDFTEEPDVQALYHSTDNWDIVKNKTEIMCFGSALKLLKEDGDLKDVDRIHKISGRYLLNDRFDPELYEKNPGKIIIGRKHASQFPEHLTQQPWQYMARLWSWPSDMTDEIIDVYDKSLDHFNERVANGGYTDIEHVLARFLNPDDVLEVDEVGIEGTIAPTGTAIKD
jgi:hypothetical protein